MFKERLAKWLAPELFARLETATKAALEVTKLRTLPRTFGYNKICNCKCRNKNHKIPKGAYFHE